MLSPCRAPSAFGTAAPAAGPVAAGRSSTLELARARAPVPSAPVPPRSGTRSERESEGGRAEKRGEHESPNDITVKRRAARASPPQDSPLPARSRARPGRPSRSRPAASPHRRLARRRNNPRPKASRDSTRSFTKSSPWHTVVPGGLLQPISSPVTVSMCVPRARSLGRSTFSMRGILVTGKRTCTLHSSRIAAKLSLTHHTTHSTPHQRAHSEEQPPTHLPPVSDYNTLGTPQNASAHLGQARSTTHASVGTRYHEETERAPCTHIAPHGTWTVHASRPLQHTSPCRSNPTG